MMKNKKSLIQLTQEYSFEKAHLPLKTEAALSEMLSQSEESFASALERELCILWLEILHPLRNSATQNRWEKHLQRLTQIITSEWEPWLDEMGFLAYFEIGDWNQAYHYSQKILTHNHNHAQNIQLYLMREHLFWDLQRATNWRVSEKSNTSWINLLGWPKGIFEWPVEWIIALVEPSQFEEYKSQEIHRLVQSCHNWGALPKFLEDEWNELRRYHIENI